MKEHSSPRFEQTEILEEIEGDYEPTEEEVGEYAAYLGINLRTDPEFLWIAREGLKASVPHPWRPCRTSEGDIYYFNFETNQSSWEHPLDQYYKDLYKSEKEKKTLKIKEMDQRFTQEAAVILYAMLEYGKNTPNKK
eukprot:TRINITY_DN6921_c0_g1_i1.p1 TRINITY_DN6921_c0_g1~~TRINITY_DN6921_c0_g1_i1.p1  ORF type:complete len:137 (+),score=24.30 TRINITY_DN6921_c0_g1_i1:156-566(+)